MKVIVVIEQNNKYNLSNLFLSFFIKKIKKQATIVELLSRGAKAAANAFKELLRNDDSE